MFLTDLGTVLWAALAPLNALASAEAVAARLTAAGVRGTPRDSLACPVVQFLELALDTDRPFAWHLDVTFGVVSLHGEMPGRLETLTFPLSPAVVDFLERFDAGAFPALVDPLAPCPVDGEVA